MTPEELHARIKLLATERNLTISSLEKKANIKKDTMKGWKGYFPSIDKGLRVANALDVSLDYLMGNSKFSTSHKGNFLPSTLAVISVLEKTTLNNDSVALLIDFIQMLERWQELHKA